MRSGSIHAMCHYYTCSSRLDEVIVPAEWGALCREITGSNEDWLCEPGIIENAKNQREPTDILRAPLRNPFASWDTGQSLPWH